MKLLAPLMLTLGLTACAGLGTSIQNVATTVDPTLSAACATAMTLAPVAGPYATFIVAGCGTASAIDKLAENPTSAAWVNHLVDQVRSMQMAKPSGKTSA